MKIILPESSWKIFTLEIRAAHVSKINDAWLLNIYHRCDLLGILQCGSSVLFDCCMFDCWLGAGKWVA